MTNWRNIKLDKIAEERRDNYQPNDDEEFPYIGLAHIEQDTLHLSGIGVSSDTKSTKRRFYIGDILFGSLRPYFRKVIFPDFEGVCSTDITVLKAREDVDSLFLFYFISNQDFIDYATNISYGTKMPRAPWRILKESEWKIPQYQTQKKIGKLLSEFDKLIENNTRHIQVLEEVAQLIYREWFVHYRFPGHENVRMVDTGTDFGEIPEGWEIRELSEFMDFVRGVEPGSKNYENEYIAGYIPFLRVGDLGKRSSDIYIKNALAKGRVLNKNNIALTLDGTVGLVGIGLEGAYSSGIRKVIIKPDSPLKRSYIYMELQSENIQGRIRTHARGTTILHASSAIGNFDFVLPDKKTLMRFDEIIELIIQQCLLLQAQADTLKDTRDLLLPILISGEIDLADLDNEVD